MIRATKMMRGPKYFAPYAPLKFFLLYLAVTLSLAAWGPIEYFMFPIGKTIIFMAAVMVALTAGYVYGVEKGVNVSRSRRPPDQALVRKIFDISLAISFTALAISLATSIINGQFNTDFSAIGDTYYSRYEDYERNTGNYSITFILYSFSLPFNFILFIFGFYYFISLDKIRRTLVVTFAVSSLMFYVLGSGKQKQLGDILVYLLTVLALRYGVRRMPIKLKWVLAVAVLSVAAVLAFVAVLGQRYGAIGVNVGNVNWRVLDLIYIDTTHPIFQIFGNKLGLNLSMFLTYLSQGYYGLGLALETDWHWTHFMGFSYSLSVIGNRFFGLEWEWPNTLLHQVGVTTGWGESKWHTVFTHFATDFTFPGTVILFGFFAYVYARAWLAATRYENPFAILMFSMLTMGAFFMPANNQLLHSPGALFTTIVVSMLYLWLGRRYNRPAAPLWGRPSRRRARAPYLP